MRKILVSLLFVVFILSACSINRKNSDHTTTATEDANYTGNTTIGGEKDWHGCLLPAGEHWCWKKFKCLAHAEKCS
jgi:hypothetical protein